MPFAAALSEHPDAVEAVAEVVGSVLDRLGPEPELAMLFTTAAHTDAFAEIAATVRHALAPGSLVGATAVSVVGGAREVEEEPGIALWAGRTAPARSVRLEAVRAGGSVVLDGLDPEDLVEASTLLLIADPFSFPSDDVIDALHREAPRLVVIGGMASAGLAPGANRLLVDDQVGRSGAVGVLFGPDQPVTAVVSQGCRPVGAPLVVTRASGNVVEEIAGRPALERLDELFRSLSERDRDLVQRGLHIGRVVDEHRAEFKRGDFLVRNVVGADRQRGSLAVGDLVEVGSTVQFHVRDARSASEDLHELLANQAAAASLVFTCNGRGTRLFGAPDHDAAAVDAITPGATAGMFCAGEIGPVGGRSFLHGFTASVAFFDEP